MTINKTSDLDNNTDTLKRITATDKPNNQTKLASIGGTPLPPSQMKCNILKGTIKLVTKSHAYVSKPSHKFYIFYLTLARAEEEAISTPTKLTNQLFVKSAMNSNNLSNANSLLNGDDLTARTVVAVVSFTNAKYSILFMYFTQLCYLHLF